MAIARRRANYRKAMKEAEVIEAHIKELQKPRPESEQICNLGETIGWDKEKADKLRRSAFLIEEERIPALLRTLAAFKTKTMPFIEDEGVVMQP